MDISFQVKVHNTFSKQKERKQNEFGDGYWSYNKDASLLLAKILEFSQIMLTGYLSNNIGSFFYSIQFSLSTYLPLFNCL